jgi:ribosomal protein S11
VILGVGAGINGVEAYMPIESRVRLSGYNSWRNNMFLTTVLIASGALALGGQVYFDRKRKKKPYWAFVASKMAAKKTKACTEGRGEEVLLGLSEKLKKRNYYRAGSNRPSEQSQLQ